ncbi:MAG: GNAT family N-acetyltransferase [Candidatus Methanosuratincola sp.]|jgi:N-acetylglutamate synthase-like GNAT family acetyltransferase|uniref:GNAT family N-acetyltransferase n=1 Tax=Candidatus Methanosuratincola petrocarbonis (ex Vanwonterghem et al. 2016) TaxID=1867261 RepID=A0A7J3UYC7_9CREN|nr:GNAT family N-acetyltransferase [Candidatus Methanosuratincola sp.]
MEIREAEPKDFPELVLMTEKEGWNYTEDDFHWFSLVGGKTLVAANQGEMIGMVTVFDYGDTGWISNLLVKPKERGHGIGGEILSECKRLLKGKKTVALFSYERSTGFYEANEFKIDIEAYLVSLKDRDRIQGRTGSVIGTELDESMIRMDQECFGYERRKVIKELAKRGMVLKPEGGDGFAIVRRDPVEPSVGPVISGKTGTGNELLIGALVLAGPNAKAVVLEEGIKPLKYEERISRLYLGAPLKIDRCRAVAFAGLELG